MFVTILRSRKARYIENITYRDLKAKEDARIAAEKSAYELAHPVEARIWFWGKIAALGVVVLTVVALPKGGGTRHVRTVETMQYCERPVARTP